MDFVWCSHATLDFTQQVLIALETVILGKQVRKIVMLLMVVEHSQEVV